MSWFEQAQDKLDREVKEIKGRKEMAMKEAVQETLLYFCRQDEEFAQAVVQGRSFAECMTAVAKGVGSSISDLDAFKKAVGFYFPGAQIDMQMVIRLEPAEASKSSQAGDPILLDFSDFW